MTVSDQFTRRRDAVTAGVLGVGIATAALITPGDARSGPAVCPFRALTGWPCPLCGSVRAWTDTAHGDFASAVAMNPTGPLTMLAAVTVAILLVVALVRGVPTTEVWRRVKPGLLALAALVTVVGLIRMGGVALDVWTWAGYS